MEMDLKGQANFNIVDNLKMAKNQEKAFWKLKMDNNWKEYFKMVKLYKFHNLLKKIQFDIKRMGMITNMI